MDSPSMSDANATLRKRSNTTAPKPDRPKFSIDDVAKHTTENDAWIVIDNKVYDVSGFAKNHPGGHAALMSQAGRDASDAFLAFHLADTREYLADFLIGELEPIPPVSKDLHDFRKLHQEITAEGYFETNLLYYLWKVSSTLAFAGFSLGILYAYPDSLFHRFIAAVSLALFWQQTGWLCHDFLHNAVFKTRKYNNWSCYFLADFCMGFCVSWWKTKHNTHHAACNEVGRDQDIDTLPILAWSHKVIPPGFFESKLGKFFVSYQHLTIIPILFFARIHWTIQSLQYALNKHNLCPDRAIEILGIVCHWIFFTSYFFWTLPVQDAIVFMLFANCLSGFFTGSVFVISHNGMLVVTPEDAKKYNINFYSLQVLTTRNIQSSVFWDWFTGTLNYQIEHHLFPTIPRHHLGKLSRKVKDVCKKHDLPHITIGYWSGLFDIIRHLSSVKTTFEREI